MVVVIDEEYFLDPSFLSKRDDDSAPSNSESAAASTSSTSSASSSSSSSGVDDLLDSHGCVVCNTTPSCPQCKSDQQCAMTTQTCAQCPTTYCIDNTDGTNATSTSSALNSAEIGGIAGGLSGFFFILLLVGVYFLYKKYKNHLLVDYELGIGEEMKELTGFNDYDDDYDGGNSGYANGVRRNVGNARSSQFLHPSNAEKRMSQTSLSTMTNSVLTKASNVLNIVYIPGVTNSRPARPTMGGSRRNTRRGVNSTYSRGMSVYSKETYFSDLENASFYGGNVATRGGNPMLVEINQDDYNYDDEDKGLHEEDEGDNYPININLQLPPLPERRQMDDDIAEEEGETDEEGDETKDDKSAGQSNNYSKGYEGDIDEMNERRRRSHFVEEEEEEDEDEEEDDAIQLDIGISNNGTNNSNSNSNNRTVPTRYAALIEKKDQTNHAQLGPFASNKDADNRAGAGDLHSESYSESSSDSDEENIEMLLHQNGQSSGNNTNSYTNTNTNSNTNSNTNTHTNTNSSNPFLSPLD